MGKGTQSPADLTGLDQLIRSGRTDAARRELKKLATAKVPRSDTAPLAALARRAGLPMTGIRFLNPIVRSDHRIPAVPTPREKCEYAGCLIQIGAFNEAETILMELSPSGLPQVFLFRAFAAIHQWEYGAAIPSLRSYIKAPGLTRYQRMVGKANLAEAFIEEKDFLKADSLIRELLHDASAEKLELLLGKALELAAQSFIRQGRHSKARDFIERSERVVGAAGTLDAFFVKKWKAILAFRDQPGAASLKGLRAIRAEAMRLMHWETARDCDRVLSVVKQDRDLFAHLLFGTPFRRFREQLVEEFRAPKGENGGPPSSYVWRLGEGGRKTVEIDLVSAGSKGLREPLVFGQNEHRLLTVLASDFYRSFRVATLYSLIYPGESFHPDVSAARIHNNVKLLRRWIERSGAPLVIDEAEGAYRLSSAGACELRVGAGHAVPKKFEAILVLKTKWPAARFSVGEASVELGISYRSAHRWLSAAAREGLVTCSGRGPATRYQFG